MYACSSLINVAFNKYFSIYFSIILEKWWL